MLILELNPRVWFFTLTALSLSSLSPAAATSPHFAFPASLPSWSVASSLRETASSCSSPPCAVLLLRPPSSSLCSAWVFFTAILHLICCWIFCYHYSLLHLIFCWELNCYIIELNWIVLNMLSLFIAALDFLLLR